MNYDHAFHAGGFSDVLKHSVFAACLQCLCAKEKPLRVIDAFAGAGRYDLTSDAAVRSPEWQAGIIPFMQTDMPTELITFFAPYMTSIARLNDKGQMRFYPGSPEIARQLTRPQDRITLLEANARMVPLLKQSMRNDSRISILNSDAWKATLGLLPPPEKRGIVLIDPPFEATDELGRLIILMGHISRKWFSGTVIAWLPLKTRAEEEFVLTALHTHALTYGKRPETLYLKLQPRPYHAGGGPLPASALIIFNPPWDVQKQARQALEHMDVCLGGVKLSQAQILPVD